MVRVKQDDDGGGSGTVTWFNGIKWIKLNQNGFILINPQLWVNNYCILMYGN